MGMTLKRQLGFDDFVVRIRCRSLVALVLTVDHEGRYTNETAMSAVHGGCVDPSYLKSQGTT